MEPLVPRRKLWFPYFKLALFFIVFVGTMYTFLELLDPHVSIDPNEWAVKKPPKVMQQMEFLRKILMKKEK